MLFRIVATSTVLLSELKEVNVQRNEACVAFNISLPFLVLYILTLKEVIMRLEVDTLVLGWHSTMLS